MRYFIHAQTRIVTEAKNTADAQKKLGLTFSQGRRFLSVYSPSYDKDAILPDNLFN